MKDSVTCNCSEESLAMGSFPMQEWCEPYELSTSLFHGTVFPCLNMKFHAAENIPNPFSDSACENLSEREKLMNEICMVGFAINDLTLYLDTHPDCKQGNKLMKELLQKRLDSLAVYAAKYNALTQLSIVIGKPGSHNYEWDEGPMPWEGGHI